MNKMLEMYDMITNPWMRLVKLDFHIETLGYRRICNHKPFDEMMERKRERYSLLVGLEHSPQELGLDPEQVKKEIKELEEFIEVNSESLRSWHSLEDERDEFYQKWDLARLGEDVDEKKKQAVLNHLPGIKETAQTMKKMIRNQHEIMKKLEASVKADNEARGVPDPSSLDRRTFRDHCWYGWETFTGWRIRGY